MFAEKMKLEELRQGIFLSPEQSEIVEYKNKHAENVRLAEWLPFYRK